MNPGSIVLASLQQADGNRKIRPALLLCEMPKFHDFLLCGISSNLRHFVQDFDEVITESDADFKTSGLVSESLVRLGFLAVLPTERIAGAIGRISFERHQRLIRNLTSHLHKTTKGTS